MNVSALVITYNRGTYICRAIDSILAQTCPVDEIVIVDDGSTDGTGDMIESVYGNRIRVVRQENRGISGARRRAIEEARGKWIAFLDSDDEWTPERNQIFLKAIVEVPDDVAWIFGDTAVMRDNGIAGTIFGVYAPNVATGPRLIEDSMSVQMPFQLGMMQSSLFRRDVLLEVDCFSEGLAHSEDFLAGMQIACLYRLAVVPQVVTRVYRTADLSQSSHDLRGRLGPDYYRARVLAFARAIETGRKYRPWNVWHAEAVRGLCRIRAYQGQNVRSLAREQFRYGFSIKSVLFFVASLTGQAGIKIWDAVARGMRVLMNLRWKPQAERTGLF
jgi:glycosyltransferase involved in cell wall biosynthesis